MSMNQNPKLLDEVRRVIRLKRYALSTERNYCSWIIQFVKYHKLNNKAALLVNAEKKIEFFLTYLAVEKGVAPATQNQAMNALVFLYKQVLEQPLDKKIDGVRSAKKTESTRGIESGRGQTGSCLIGRSASVDS